MKFILYLITYITLGITSLLAQQLPAPLPNSPDLVNIVRGTKTDPCNPQNFPRALPDGQDLNVDWRVQCFPLNKSFVQNQNCPNNVQYQSICPGNTFTTGDFIYIKSPFYSDQSYLQNYLSPLTLDLPPVRRTYNESDFQPNEGWELVKFHLGKIKTPELYNINDNTGPYLVLYNRYSSTLRIFYAYPYQDAQTIGVTVKFRDFIQGENNDRFNRYSVSGLFGNVNGISQPLDQVTKTAQATSFAISPNDPSGNAFFVVDIPVAYDPCTCHWPSFLEFKFTKITEATLNAEGRTLGYTGSVSLLNDNGLNQDELSKYLIAINNSGDGTTSQGVSFYKDFNELIQKFEDMQVHYENAEQLQQALETFKLIFTVGGAAADLEGVKAAFEVLSGVTEFFSGRNTPEPPGVIIAESKIVGTVNTRIRLQNAEFSLMNPGNKRSNDNVGINFVPAYNEVLGDFALLNTPRILKRFKRLSDERYAYNGNILSRDISDKTQFTVIDALQFAFNPALDINYQKTEIKAALVFMIPKTKEFNGHPSFSQYPDVNVQLSEFSDLGNLKKIYETTDSIVYITPFISPDCLSGLYAQINDRQVNGISGNTLDGRSVLSFNQFSIKLRLSVNIEYFSRDRNGNPNKSYKIFTYPCKIETLDLNNNNGMDFINAPIYPFELTISDEIFRQPRDGSIVVVAYAWEKITITGNVSSNFPNTPVIVRSGGEIIQSDGSIINPNIILEPRKEPPLLCYFGNNPVPPDQIVSFCRRNNPDFQYKANEYHGRPLEGRKANPITEKSNNTFNFSAYPNPTTGEVWLKADNNTNTTASVELTDLMGKTVFPLNTVTFQDGLSTAPLTLNGLSSGVYLLKISTSEKTTISKLVIQKD